jgi:hypothetical protein
VPINLDSKIGIKLFSLHLWMKLSCKFITSSIRKYIPKWILESFCQPPKLKCMFSHKLFLDISIVIMHFQTSSTNSGGNTIIPVTAHTHQTNHFLHFRSMLRSKIHLLLDLYIGEPYLQQCGTTYEVMILYGATTALKLSTFWNGYDNDLYL